MFHGDGITAKAAQPFYHVIGIGDAAAEQEQLRLWRREGEGEFVIEAAITIADELVFINDEEVRSVAVDEAALLGFERGHKNGGVEIF